MKEKVPCLSSLDIGFNSMSLLVVPTDGTGLIDISVSKMDCPSSITSGGSRRYDP